MSPYMQSMHGLTLVMDKSNCCLRGMKLTTFRGRFSSNGASRSMLPKTQHVVLFFSFDQDYFSPTRFLLPSKVFNETTLIFFSFDQGYFSPTGFFLPDKVFNETTLCASNFIIHWWTSKGECYKYYNLCGCPRNYSLLMYSNVNSTSI